MNALCSGLQLEGAAGAVMRLSCGRDVCSVTSSKMTQGLILPICKEMVRMGRY